MNRSLNTYCPMVNKDVNITLQAPPQGLDNIEINEELGTIVIFNCSEFTCKFYPKDCPFLPKDK